ncbi:MAG: Dynamin-like GTPase that mediates homotypic ER fusion [Bogoriella megaspora]|nr:MAG: Dynamin-like GTPase that mediates homotypic ER fusion [Bogoriella megaspora]
MSSLDGPPLLTQQRSTIPLLFRFPVDIQHEIFSYILPRTLLLPLTQLQFPSSEDSDLFLARGEIALFMVSRDISQAALAYSYHSAIWRFYLDSGYNSGSPSFYIQTPRVLHTSLSKDQYGRYGHRAYKFKLDSFNMLNCVRKVRIDFDLDPDGHDPDIDLSLRRLVGKLNECSLERLTLSLYWPSLRETTWVLLTKAASIDAISGLTPLMHLKPVKTTKVMGRVDCDVARTLELCLTSNPESLIEAFALDTRVLSDAKAQDLSMRFKKMANDVYAEAKRSPNRDGKAPLYFYGLLLMLGWNGLRWWIDKLNRS